MKKNMKNLEKKTFERFINNKINLENSIKIKGGDGGNTPPDPILPPPPTK